MKRFSSVWLIALLLLGLWGCGGSAVQLTSYSPSGEVDELSTFEFEFNSDLAPAESQDVWMDEAFVEFEPAIPGKFKWVSGNYLIFSPEATLLPGMDYKAKVTEKVLFNSGKKGDFEKISFHTPNFDATRVDFFWTQVKKSDYMVTVQANVKFNYDVNPADLREFLYVEKAGQEIKDYKIVSDEPGDIIALDFGQQKQVDKDQTFIIKVKKGLKSPMAPKALSEDRTFTQSLPPLTRLAITQVTSGFDGQKGWIEVFTTQRVDEDALKKYVNISQKKKLKYIVFDNSFRIESAFEPGSFVELTIKKGLPGLYGGRTSGEYKETVVMADMEPDLRFLDKDGQYLMRSGANKMAVNAVNIDEVEVEIYQVFNNNLLFFLYNNGGGSFYDEFASSVATGRSYDDYYEDDYYYDDYYYDDYYQGKNYNVNNYGKLIHSEYINLAEFKNKVQSFEVDLSKHLNSRFKGCYVVKVRDGDERWRYDSKFVSVSDIGIIAKRSYNGLIVWANSLATAEPMEGVDIKLVSSNNQTLLAGRTNSEGYVEFTGPREAIEGYYPRMITAKKGEDFNFVDLKDTQIETSRYDVGGKYEYSNLYDTYIYADRNLFRPGEKAHLSAIVRNKEFGVVQEIPMRMKVIGPTGKTFREVNKDLTPQGSFETELDFPLDAQTGDYTAEVYTGGSQMLGSYRISVEEFVPDKIRVNVDVDKEKTEPGEEVRVDVSSEYLFGAPNANADYEVDVRLIHRSFSSQKFSGYNFSNTNIDNTSLDNGLTEDKLDDQGKATFNYSIPEDIDAEGLLNGTAYVSVFDATGRTVNRSASFTVIPNDYYIGLKTMRYYYSTESPIEVMVGVVDGNDKPKSKFPLSVEIVRHTYETVLTRNNNGNFVYRSEKREKTVKKDNVTFNGSALPYKFNVKESGQYEVRVSKKGSDRYSSTSLYAYGSASSTASSFEVDKEGRVEIVMEKDKYNVGDQAKLLFTTPFSGRMLVTLERNEVFEHHYVDVVNNSAELEVTMTEQFLPNVYVSATLFKPHTPNSPVPFLVAHGYESITVEKPDNKLPVTIIAPDKIKPRTTQTITVRSAPEEDIYVTLAVVDEGILQIKNYQTPDPYGFMYAKRRLRVNSFDLYEMLLPELGNSSPAGGDENGSSKRINPVTAERFKLLSYWSGIRKTDSKGEVNLKVPIPQFNGGARIMAVAYSGSRFGSADKDLKIADDIVVMPAIPRFLTLGDSMALPITLMNTTTKSGKVDCKVSVEGPLKVTSGASQSVSFKGKETKTVNFGISSKEDIGVGKIKVQITGLDKVTDEIEIAVRPASPLVVEDGNGTIRAGESKVIDIPTDYLAATQNTSLAISKFPAVKFAKHLKYLKQYPYGCVEQTTSKLFPQLYFDELAAMVAPDENFKGNAVYFVNEGIIKFQSLQMSNGGLSYWPGGGYANWWSCTYAAHFLVEADKKGFNVPSSLLSGLLDYLHREANSKSTYNYRTWRNNGSIVEVKARKEAIYSLYVLSLAGRPDFSLMNYYRARPHLLTGDTQYLLAGAFGLQNKWNAFNDLMPNAFTAETPERTSGGTFDSEIRANSLILSILCDVDPDNSQIPLLVKHLTKLGENAYSTQDRSWLFLALGKAAGKNANAKAQVAVSAGGQKIGTYNDKDLRITTDRMNGKQVKLTATGTGEVYYFWNTEGVKRNADFAALETDKNLKIRREYYDRSGNKITANNFRQGDLIVAKIKILGGQRSVQNVAISDLIPAGFEIENPRLGTSTSLSWIRNTLYPQYMDVRDDRLLLFLDVASGKEVEFHYMIRVVNAGEFVLPPISAEAMYDPEYRSMNGGSKVSVAPRGNGGS